MEFMEWSAEVASAHPQLSGAFIHIDEEWLDILLQDGRTFRFRPAQLIDPTTPEPQRRERLNKLITIGVANAEPPAASDPAAHPASQETSNPEPAVPHDPSSPHGPTSGPTPDSPSDVIDTHMEFDVSEEDGPMRDLMPIVRRAEYFVASHHHASDDSFIYVPLTPFIGAGVAMDTPQEIMPLRFSRAADLGLPTDPIPLFHSSLAHLRTATFTNGMPSVQVQPHPIGGAQAYEFAGPANYQSSWLLDVEMALSVADSMSKAHHGALPLFVPAARDHLYLVMADDPNLVPMFRALAGTLSDPDSIYPLPHVVTNDGWSEWIPMRDHPVARILAKIRSACRERIYARQVEIMEAWPENFGHLAPCDQIRDGGAPATCARWTSTDGYGSLPDTDYIAFVRHGSPHPWDNDPGDVVVLRSQVARDVWHEGISPMNNVWPPRWNVQGFPDRAQLNALRDAAGREL